MPVELSTATTTTAIAPATVATMPITPVTVTEQTAPGQQVVVRQETESVEEFTRRRNRIYNQRWAAKVKQSDLNLETQANELKRLNMALQHDNQQLLNLLTLAQHIVAVHKCSNNNQPERNNWKKPLLLPGGAEKE